MDRLGLDHYLAAHVEVADKLPSVLCCSHRRLGTTAVNELARESFRFITGDRYRSMWGTANGHADEYRRGNAEASSQWFGLASVDLTVPFSILLITALEPIS